MPCDYAVLSSCGGGHDYPGQQSFFPDRFHQLVHFEVAVHLERLIFPRNKQVYWDFFFVILDCRFIAEEVVHIQFSGVVGSSEIECHLHSPLFENFFYKLTILTAYYAVFLGYQRLLLSGAVCGFDALAYRSFVNQTSVALF